MIFGTDGHRKSDSEHLMEKDPFNLDCKGEHCGEWELSKYDPPD
jgi:hypothetical protein